MRKTLGETRLENVRLLIRGGGFVLLLALAVLGFAGYVTPAHTVNGGTWHSNYDDGGAMPLLVLAAFGVVVAHLRTRVGLGAGMLAGLLGPVTAVLVLKPVFLVHMFADVQTGLGDLMMLISVMGLFLGGLAMMIAEPILYATQRRANERTNAQIT